MMGLRLFGHDEEELVIFPKKMGKNISASIEANPLMGFKPFQDEQDFKGVVAHDVKEAEEKAKRMRR